MSHWTIGQRTARLLGAALLLVLCALAIVVTANAFVLGAPFNDFFANWSAAQLYRAGQIGRVYDLAFLNAFRQSLDSAFDPTQPYLILPFTYLPDLPARHLAAEPAEVFPRLRRLARGHRFPLYAAALLPWIERKAGLACCVAPPGRAGQCLTASSSARTVF